MLSKGRFQTELLTIEKVTDQVVRKLDIQDPAQNHAGRQALKHLVLAAAYLESMPDGNGHEQELILTGKVAECFKRLHGQGG